MTLWEFLIDRHRPLSDRGPVDVPPSNGGAAPVPPIRPREALLWIQGEPPGSHARRAGFVGDDPS